MIKKIPSIIALCLMAFLSPVSADDGKPNQEIGDLSIVDFHKETLSIPYVFVKNLDPQFDGLCFAVELVQNGSANNWKVEHAELVECPPSAAALTDTPEDPPSDNPDDSNSNGESSEDGDSEEEDPVKDDSSEDDSSEDETGGDNSREDDSEEDEPEEEDGEDLAY